MKPFVLVSAWLSLLVSGVAFAATIPGQPDPEHGKTLAQSLCSNCHLVGAGTQEHVNADVPSFREIANVPGRTPGDIIGFIILPKHPMPANSAHQGRACRSCRLYHQPARPALINQRLRETSSLARKPCERVSLKVPLRVFQPG